MFKKQGVKKYNWLCPKPTLKIVTEKRHLLELSWSVKRPHSTPSDKFYFHVPGVKLSSINENIVKQRFLSQIQIPMYVKAGT